jgi:hypothetical protein
MRNGTQYRAVLKKSIEAKKVQDIQLSLTLPHYISQWCMPTSIDIVIAQSVGYHRHITRTELCTMLPLLTWLLSILCTSPIDMILRSCLFDGRGVTLAGVKE